jgi:hypothetical protein
MSLFSVGNGVGVLKNVIFFPVPVLMVVDFLLIWKLVTSFMQPVRMCVLFDYSIRQMLLFLCMPLLIWARGVLSFAARALVCSSQAVMSSQAFMCCCAKAVIVLLWLEFFLTFFMVFFCLCFLWQCSVLLV